MGDFFSNVLPGLAYGPEGLNAKQAVQTSELQAQLSRQALARTQQINAREEANARRRAREAFAKQRAGIGPAGVTPAGSPLLALAGLSQDTAGELDVLTQRNRARAESAFGQSLLNDQRAAQAREYNDYLPYFRMRKNAEKAAGAPR